MRLSRLHELYVDWYHRKFPVEAEASCLRWNFLKDGTVHYIFISVRGVKLLALVVMDVAGNPFIECHSGKQFVNLNGIDGFYHGGRLYPARLLNLYLKVGLNAQ